LTLDPTRPDPAINPTGVQLWHDVSQHWFHWLRQSTSRYSGTSEAMQLYVSFGSPLNRWLWAGPRAFYEISGVGTLHGSQYLDVHELRSTFNRTLKFSRAVDKRITTTTGGPSLASSQPASDSSSELQSRTWHRRLACYLYSDKKPK